MMLGGRYSTQKFTGWGEGRLEPFTLQFLHEILSRGESFAVPVGGLVHVLHGIEHEKSTRRKKQRAWCVGERVRREI